MAQPVKIRVENPSLTVSNGSNPRTFKPVWYTDEYGWLELHFHDASGNDIGEPCYFKGTDGDGRLAMELRGCSGTYFIVDGNGHITNG